MARSLSEILRAMNDKIAILSDRLDALETENANLRHNLELTGQQRDEAVRERDRALLDVEFLTMSHRLADNPESVALTRRRLNQMIRTIDRCVTLLKEDPQT